MLCKKNPVPDGIGHLAIRCIYDWPWEPDRVETLIRAHIRLGTHPAKWKTVRGVTIPKLGKDGYGLTKADRVISLLTA